jgi:hypothetical protein
VSCLCLLILIFACLLFLCYVYVSIFGEKHYRAYMFCICKIYRIWCSTHIVLYFFFFFLCLVYPMLPVSLDCPFLLVPSVFSNIYILSNDDNRRTKTTFCATYIFVSCLCLLILIFACLLFLCYVYVSIFGEKH